MKTMLTKYCLVSLFVLVLVACKPDQKVPGVEAGSLNVSKYVAVGNSITAGFADNALYYDGQIVSYTNLLANQFKLIGGGEFKIPLLPMSSVGVGGSKNSKLTLGYKADCAGVKNLSPVGTIGDTMVFYNSVAALGPFNNMGVPGAKAITSVFKGYGNPNNGAGFYNPFFARMLAPSEYQSASMLSKAAAQHATFFSLFLGNNDVLGYASSGGTEDFITASSGIFGYDAAIDQIVDTMMASGAKQGVIANVPDVTSLPLFTTVPYNGLVLTETQAANLTAAYSQLGITFHEGANAFMIVDANAPGGRRQIKSNEFILLTVSQDMMKCGGWGSSIPLADEYVLNAAEIANVQTAVAGYNAKLRSVADAKGLAYVDVNAFMMQAKKGIVYNGVTTSATFVSGGAFSLDGVHLTPKGNALLANEFIKAINAKYGSTLPLLNVGDYKGVVFPN